MTYHPLNYFVIKKEIPADPEPSTYQGFPPVCVAIDDWHFLNLLPIFRNNWHLHEDERWEKKFLSGSHPKEVYTNINNHSTYVEGVDCLITPFRPVELIDGDYVEIPEEEEEVKPFLIYHATNTFWLDIEKDRDKVPLESFIVDDKSCCSIEYEVIVDLQFENYSEYPDIHSFFEYREHNKKYYSDAANLSYKIAVQKDTAINNERIKDNQRYWQEACNIKPEPGQYLPIHVQKNFDQVNGILRLDEEQDGHFRGKLFLLDEDIAIRKDCSLMRTSKCNFGFGVQSVTKKIATILHVFP
jgi:hypothetical protein